MMAESPGTTWVNTSYTNTLHIGDIHTFPMPVIANSSEKDQMVSVRLSKIRLKLSPIRSRV